VKPFLLLGLFLLLPLGVLRANPARLIAYAVRSPQIEAARVMTADECRAQLPVLWSEGLELKLNGTTEVSRSVGGRSATLQIDTAPVAGTLALRLTLRWAETVKPATGPERQRGLNTSALVPPGTGIVVARNLTQVVANGEKADQVSGGVIYVLSLAPAQVR
jgi:hypothetical protein